MAERVEPVAMTLREVAERLQIGKTSVHRLVTTGELAAFRVTDDGVWRVLVRDFEAFVDSRRAAAEQAYQRAKRAS